MKQFRNSISELPEIGKGVLIFGFHAGVCITMLAFPWVAAYAAVKSTNDYSGLILIVPVALIYDGVLILMFLASRH